MKEGQKLWSREELILAINLYCKISFGKMHHRNPLIIEFANLIGRTPSSVTFKLGNLASFDASFNPPSYEIYKKDIERDNPEVSANVLLSLVNVTTYLLSKQMITLEKIVFE